MAQYICHKQFDGDAICGQITIPVGSKLTEQNNYLYYEGRKVCVATSENGWEHFHLGTLAGEQRYQMVSALEKIVEDGGDIVHSEEYLASTRNRYWKNLIRTAPDAMLAELYQRYILRGGK